MSPETKLTDWWRLKASYSFLQIQLHLVSNSVDTNSEGAEGRSPHHQVSVRSSMDIANNWQFDAWLRYVDSVPDLKAPSYTTLDLRLAWKPFENLEISIVGQNLLDSKRPEFSSEILSTNTTEVQRGFYSKFTWKF